MYGHNFGDIILKKVSNALLVEAKKVNGFAARYGGDEFCFVSEGDIDSETLKKNIRESVENNCQDVGCHVVEISIGSCKCVSNEITLDELIEAADKNLYLDKKRNVKR